MRNVLILSIPLLFLGCDTPESKTVVVETIVTTPDGVIIREGEIAQYFEKPEDKLKFIEYLEKNGLYYRLDDRFANEVNWIPESVEHQKLVFRGAHGIPENQINAVFSSPELAEEFTKVLEVNGIEFVHHDEINSNVVLWYPNSDEEKAYIENLGEK